MRRFLTKLFYGMILCASAALAVYFGFLIYDAYCQRESLEDKNETLSRKISAFQADNDYKRSYHDRLANDEEFAERVIRETLGYVGEREVVFKFDERYFSPKAGTGVTVEAYSDKKDTKL